MKHSKTRKITLTQTDFLLLGLCAAWLLFLAVTQGIKVALIHLSFIVGAYLLGRYT